MPRENIIVTDRTGVIYKGRGERMDKYKEYFAAETAHRTLAEALGRRYRRVYVWVYSVLALSWCIHIWLHPFPATSLQEVLYRPIMGYIPAYVVLTIGFFFYFALLAFGLGTFRMREASGEVFRSRPGEPEEDPPKE